jgi:signal transduction histidine kinase
MMQTRIALPAIFAGVVMSFVAATGYVHWEMRSIDRTALDIADASAPSIEHLAAARSDLRHLQLVLRRERERQERGERFDPTPVEESRHVVDNALEAYLGEPLVAGERSSREHVREVKNKLDVMLRDYEASDGDAEIRRQLLNVFAEVGDATTQALEIDAMRTRESALRIRELRNRAGHVALGLDVVCTVIAILGVLFIRRVSRAERDLVERRRRLQEERATELEDFAGRIAHDILSPVGAVGFALDILKRTNDPAQRERVADRGTSALGRVQRLVNGLLEFARAGGRPSAEAHANVDQTVADLVAELRPAADEKSVTLTTNVDRSLIAACNPGVLTSLVANLARNALKYLGASVDRRIEIRALERGSFVHVEVEDTGPGLAPELQERVFEPYVRGAEDQPGVGLGLATVKRLAEAHGGCVGVKSRPGAGATFWFEVPRAGAAISERRLTA